MPWPKGQRFVQVDAQLYRAVKSSHRSLQLHRAHDGLTGVTHHQGRLASRLAYESGGIDEVEFKRASFSHREAGRLKHNISRPARNHEGDQHFDKDPWATWTRRNRRQGDESETSEAEESRSAASTFDATMLVDVLVNGAMRMLVEEIRAADLGLRGEVRR